MNQCNPNFSDAFSWSGKLDFRFADHLKKSSICIVAYRFQLSLSCELEFWWWTDSIFRSLHRNSWIAFSRIFLTDWLSSEQTTSSGRHPVFLLIPCCRETQFALSDSWTKKAPVACNVLKPAQSSNLTRLDAAGNNEMFSLALEYLPFFHYSAWHKQGRFQ